MGWKRYARRIGPGLIVAGLAGASLAQGLRPLTPKTFRVSVGETSGTGSPDMFHFGRGIGDLIITDMVQMLYEDPTYADCDMGILEWRRRADILKEFQLQQSRYIDPATVTMHRMPPEPTALIEGTVSDAPDAFSWKMTMRDRASGNVLAVSEGSVPIRDFWDASGIIAREMMDAACPPGWEASGGGANMTVSGHVARIDSPFLLNGVFPGANVVFSYAPSGPLAGTVSYTFSGGGFSGTGTGSYTLTEQEGKVYRLEQTTTGCVDGAPNSCRSNSEVITLTPVKS